MPGWTQSWGCRPNSEEEVKPQVKGKTRDQKRERLKRHSLGEGDHLWSDEVHFQKERGCDTSEMREKELNSEKERGMAETSWGREKGSWRCMLNSFIFSGDVEGLGGGRVDFRLRASMWILALSLTVRVTKTSYFSPLHWGKLGHSERDEWRFITIGGVMKL